MINYKSWSAKYFLELAVDDDAYNIIDHDFILTIITMFDNFMLVNYIFTMIGHDFEAKDYYDGPWSLLKCTRSERYGFN